MKKIYLSSLVIAFLLICVSSCQKDHRPNLIEPKNQSSMIQESSKKGKDVDVFMEKLAKKLAKNISKKRVSENLKNLLSKRFDGDYDVLLSDFYSLNEIKDLVEDNEKFDFASLGNPSEFINISMPIHFEDWDIEKFSPLVAIKSVFYDEKSNNRIFAFNSKGEQVELDSKNAPNQPIIVIGLNERVVLNENKKAELKPEFKNRALQITDRQINDLHDFKDEEVPDDGGGGGSGTTNSGPGTGRYHVNYCYEYLTAINCTDIDQYEGWIAGAPELRLLVHYKDYNENKIADQYAVNILMEPDRRSDINNKWWNLPNDQQLWVWDYTHSGLTQLYSWYEEDESISFSSSNLIPLATNFKTLVALPGGVYTIAFLALATSFTIKGSTEFIGQVAVDARPNIYEYGVGTGLRFRSRTKYCAESDQGIFNYVQ